MKKLKTPSIQEIRDRIEAGRQRAKLIPPSKSFRKFNLAKIYQQCREFHGEDPFHIEVIFFDDNTFSWQSAHNRWNGKRQISYGLVSRNGEFPMQTLHAPPTRQGG